MEHSRKHSFTLAGLLTFVTAVPVCIGIVAAVEFTASYQSYEWFGGAWYSDVRHFLVDRVGVPVSFVARYVSFAMIDVPGWVCCVAIAFVLGLIRSKLAFIVGVAFIPSVCVWDFTSDYFSGLHGHLNLRLVSLFGVSVIALSFAVSRRIRGGTQMREQKTGRIAIGFTCVAIGASLAVSQYGWSLVNLHREAGLEVQEMFRNAEP